MKFKKVIKIIILNIIILIFISIISYVTFNFIKEPSKIFLIKKDILSDEEIVETLILREEQVITDSSNRILQQEKFEGEKISKGAKVFRYYSNSETKKIDRIAEIDKEIEEYLIEQQDNFNLPENAIIDSSIETKLLKLNEMNQQSRILNFEKSINDEILQKQKLQVNFQKKELK